MPSLPTEFSDRAAALAPDFALRRELGRGGMGVVYLALDVRLDREVAIKVLPEALAQSSDVRDRFLREGRTAAKLSHPNIVPIYRADEIGGAVFLVMGFVDGPSLGERLSVSGTIPQLESARVLRDVATALDYAHSRGVIHRDIKPENVLLDRASGRALVTDFGIARLVEAAPLTQAGQVLGSVHYMSPEQVSGEPIDGRSDLYALGVVGFRMLTGRLPFDNPVASAVMLAHVTKPAPAVRDIAPDVPASLATVIDRCLQKNPADRYASGAALALALEESIDPNRAGAGHALPVAGPELLSEREKDAVLSLAAQLQDATASHDVQPRPSPPANHPGAADARDKRSMTSGYRLASVEEAAAEAGIDPQFVARAVAELGLTDRPAQRVPAATERGSMVGAPAHMGQVVTRRFAGLPIGIGQTVELDRPLGDREWERLVADLRETFHAAGTVQYDGPFRQWRNGNLTVLVEPAGDVHRIRIQTMNGNSRALLRGGLGVLGVGAVTVIMTAAGHGLTAGSVAGSAFMAVAGAAMIGVGALRLPSWARRRRGQFEAVMGRIASGQERRVSVAPRGLQAVDDSSE